MTGCRSVCGPGANVCSVPQPVVNNALADDDDASGQLVSYQQPLEDEVLPSPIPDDDGTELTLEYLESTALSSHPALAEGRARIEALYGKHLQAGLATNPYIGYSGQQLGSGGRRAVGQR